MSSGVAISYTVVFEDVGGGWVQARLHELPGVITAAPSRQQAAEDVVEALREYLLSLRDVPAPGARPRMPPTPSNPPMPRRRRRGG